MPIKKAIPSQKAIKTPPKRKEIAPKKPARQRDVILAPDLFEAVLESVQQVKDGQTISHEEVKRRNGL